MIPPAQQRAAEIAARLHVEGALDGTELLPDLLRAARKAAPHLDPAGLRMKIAHVLADNIYAMETARFRAWTATRWKIASAVNAGLVARRPKLDILAAVDAADPEGLLSEDERGDIIAAALRRALGARG